MTCRNGARANEDHPQPVNRFDAGPFDKDRFLVTNMPWGAASGESDGGNGPLNAGDSPKR